MIVIQSLFILFYFFVFLIYYLTKVVQGERKTKRKRVKPPWRWLVVRGYGLDTLTNTQ